MYVFNDNFKIKINEIKKQVKLITIKTTINLHTNKDLFTMKTT